MLNFSLEREKRPEMGGKGSTQKKISAGFRGKFLVGMGAMLWESYGMSKIAKEKDFKRCCHGF